jgi:hypothetical protein
LKKKKRCHRYTHMGRGRGDFTKVSTTVHIYEKCITKNEDAITLVTLENEK